MINYRVSNTRLTIKLQTPENLQYLCLLWGTEKLQLTKLKTKNLIPILKLSYFFLILRHNTNQNDQKIRNFKDPKKK